MTLHESRLIVANRALTVSLFTYLTQEHVLACLKASNPNYRL